MREASSLFAQALALPFAAREDTRDLYGRRVSSIRVEGLRRTWPCLVLDQMASRISEPFTAKKQRLAEFPVSRLGIFKFIQVTPSG